MLHLLLMQAYSKVQKVTLSAQKHYRQQMAVVIVRAINEITRCRSSTLNTKKIISLLISTDLDKAFSSEQTDAIKALEFAEITIVPDF